MKTALSFAEFKPLLQAHIDTLFADGRQLYVTGVTKDELWDTYLESFPPGTNEIVKERREYDCQHCKQFIRGFGAVVVINDDNTVSSIWDVAANDTTFGPVVKAMRDCVTSKPVADVFSTTLKEVGVDFNMSQAENGDPIRWRHLYTKIPASHRNKSRKSDATLMGVARDSKNVLRRSLDTISTEALETVVELIKQDSIYRGGEWLEALQKLRGIMYSFRDVDEALRGNFCWRVSNEVGPVISKIRNHSMGVLLVDVSDGEPLDKAVKKYEAIVAPTNYKRPKPIFTKKMLQDAKDAVERLGLTKSLHRRFATIDDITVNNVLFADRGSIQRMTGGDVFDELENDVKVNPKKFDRATEIPIDKFVVDVLPTADKIEMLLEPRHKKNVVSLIAPVHLDSKPMFKWGNNFSWAYTGNITDSMAERVLAAGGRVDGVLRFTLEWNHDGQNQSLMDLHAFFPGTRHSDGQHDRYPATRRVGWNHRQDKMSGALQDVDNVEPPGRNVPIENITFPDINRMPEGTYMFKIHNWNARRPNTSGFRAELAFGGEIYQFERREATTQKEWTTVARVTLKNKQFTIEPVMNSSASTVEVCGLKSNQLHPVSVCLLSPNHWDGKSVGNKHYMFMLQGLKNDECPNGFFNEFLPKELEEHKRVFAALGSKMQVEPSDNQLSGLGFSSTKRDSVTLKVHGRTTRVLKVMI
jgi:hypothetical protein